MNKKIILFGIVLAFFIMVMVPNISALEYQTVKEAYVEKNVNVEYLIDNLLQKLENFLELPTTLIVLITAILQAIFVISSFLLAQFLVKNVDNILIGIIFNPLSGALTGFIISKWSSYIQNNFELSKIDELILSYLPMIIFYIFAMIYIFIGFDNSSQKNTDNNFFSINTVASDI